MMTETQADVLHMLCQHALLLIDPDPEHPGPLRYCGPSIQVVGPAGHVLKSSTIYRRTLVSLLGLGYVEVLLTTPRAVYYSHTEAGRQAIMRHDQHLRERRSASWGRFQSS